MQSIAHVFCASPRSTIRDRRFVRESRARTETIAGRQATGSRASRRAPACVSARSPRSRRKARGQTRGLGNPLAFLLTPGQAHDLAGADALLAQMAADLLIADRAFDADKRVLQPLAAAGKSAVIPPRPNRVAPRQFDQNSTKRATGSRISSVNSSSSAPLPRAMTRPPEISSPPSTSRPVQSGSIDDTP
jgi:hypothetical protein